MLWLSTVEGVTGCTVSKTSFWGYFSLLEPTLIITTVLRHQIWSVYIVNNGIYCINVPDDPILGGVLTGVCSLQFYDL